MGTHHSPVLSWTMGLVPAPPQVRAVLARNCRRDFPESLAAQYIDDVVKCRIHLTGMGAKEGCVHTRKSPETEMIGGRVRHKAVLRDAHCAAGLGSQPQIPCDLYTAPRCRRESGRSLGIHPQLRSKPLSRCTRPNEAA